MGIQIYFSLSELEMQENDSVIVGNRPKILISECCVEKPQFPLV